MDDVDKLIREDKVQHPSCGYSISNSKTCRSKDGSLVCEIIKSVNRNCPNERSVNIYSSNSTVNETASSGTDRDPYYHDPFDLFKELDRQSTSLRDQMPRKPEKELKNPTTWIEFRLGNDTFEDKLKSDEGLIGSILKKFGIEVSSGSSQELQRSDSRSSNLHDSNPKVPPGTKVGPPEDI